MYFKNWLIFDSIIIDHKWLKMGVCSSNTCLYACASRGEFTLDLEDWRQERVFQSKYVTRESWHEWGVAVLFIKRWLNNTTWGTSYGTTNLPSNQPVVGTKIWSYSSLKKGCVHLHNQQTWMSNCQTKWETLWICQFLFFINISTVQPIDTRISALKCEWKMPWNWQQCEREVWTLSLHVSNFPTLQA